MKPSYRHLKQIYRELRDLTPFKEARAFHKKYKKYGFEISLSERYPKLPAIVSWFSVGVSLMALITSIILLTR